MVTTAASVSEMNVCAQSQVYNTQSDFALETTYYGFAARSDLCSLSISELHFPILFFISIPFFFFLLLGLLYSLCLSIYFFKTCGFDRGTKKKKEKRSMLLSFSLVILRFLKKCKCISAVAALF